MSQGESPKCVCRTAVESDVLWCKLATQLRARLTVTSFLKTPWRLLPATAHPSQSVPWTTVVAAWGIIIQSSYLSKSSLYSKRFRPCFIFPICACLVLLWPQAELNEVPTLPGWKWNSLLLAQFSSLLVPYSGELHDDLGKTGGMNEQEVRSRGHQPFEVTM